MDVSHLDHRRNSIFGVVFGDTAVQVHQLSQIRKQKRQQGGYGNKPNLLRSSSDPTPPNLQLLPKLIFGRLFHCQAKRVHRHHLIHHDHPPSKNKLHHFHQITFRKTKTNSIWANPNKHSANGQPMMSPNNHYVSHSAKINSFVAYIPGYGERGCAEVLEGIRCGLCRDKTT